MTTASRDIVVADPCAQPNPPLVAAALRAGALGVLDLNELDPRAAAADLAEVARRTPVPFAVRLAWTGDRDGDGDNAAARRSRPPLVLPDQVDTVVVTGGATGFAEFDPAAPEADGGMATGGLAARWPGRRLLVEVTSRDEADVALAAGAHGLIAKGCESGGRIGDTESFVLAQQIAELGVPFWLQGGFGLRTAAAAFAAGATGVVLDAQLALVRESSLTTGPTGDADTRTAVAAMDGSETRVVGDHRFYVRPDLPAAKLAATTPAATVAARLGPDLHHDLLPLGQDAAVAAGLAGRHVTVGGVVQAVRAAVAEQLRAAAEHPPLAPGAGVSTTNGTRYPVVQGPMTRVSDRAEMAA
ncbi:MAG TPA: hypothetical protein VGO78_22535, partial [Acidimicrobiales bacterium]|nr:hypothetical protein [Acidimicrobiales bacterium]